MAPIKKKSRRVNRNATFAHKTGKIRKPPQSKKETKAVKYAIITKTTTSEPGPIHSEDLPSCPSTLHDLEMIKYSALQNVAESHDMIDRILKKRHQPSTKLVIAPEQRVESLGSVVFFHGGVYQLRSVAPGSTKDHSLQSITATSSVSATTQVAQGLFFVHGTLKLERIPLFQYDPSADDLLWQCGSKGNHTSTCHTFASSLITLQDQFLNSLVLNVYEWITLMMIKLPLSLEVLEKKHRLELWDSLLVPDCIVNIFSFLAPGLNLQKLASNPLLAWASQIIVRISDDIFMYHYALPSYDSWLFYVKLRFREWVQGVERVVVVAEIPLGGELIVEY